MASEEDHNLDRFQHERLESPRGQIRLLKLLPGTSSTIECTIETPVRLAQFSTCAYTAVSYTWEPENPKQEIKINGKLLEVGLNIYTLLQTLRSSPDYDFERQLWVDSICIDQNCDTGDANHREDTLKEKSEQVSQMWSVYRFAQEVLVWLGPASEGSSSAMKFLSQGGYDSVRTLEVDKGQYDALESLFQRRYWTRLWVVQELCMGRTKTKFMCGDDTCGWKDVKAVCAAAEDYTIPPSRNSGFCCSDAMIPLFDRDENVFLNLDEAIINFRDYNCQKQHDRVYALIGLVVRVEEISTDYSITLEELLIRVLCIVSQRRDRIVEGYGGLLKLCKVLAEILKIRLDNTDCDIIAALVTCRIEKNVVEVGEQSRNKGVSRICWEIVHNRSEEWCFNELEKIYMIPGGQKDNLSRRFGELVRQSYEEHWENILQESRKAFRKQRGLDRSI